MAVTVKRTVHIDVAGIVRSSMPDAVLAVAEAGVGQARALATVDEGQLRKSISAELLDDEKAVYGPSAEHGIYIEFGTGKHAEKGGRKTPWTYYSEKLQRFVRTEGQVAQPFLRPSADWLRRKAGKIYAKILKRAL